MLRLLSNDDAKIRIKKCHVGAVLNIRMIFVQILTYKLNARSYKNSDEGA